MSARSIHQAPTTQAEYAYDVLKREIISGQLPGGSRIRQVQCAANLRISVTPVREAIRRLEQDGLVTSEAHRGATVLGLTLERAEEIYAMRFVVEPLQIERSMGKMSDADFARAEHLCDEMATLTDALIFTDLNQEFHEITMAYDDSWTSRVVRLLAAAAAPYVSRSLQVHPEHIAKSNLQHYATLEALREGVAEKVIEIELAHLESTLAILRRHFADDSQVDQTPELLA